MSFRKRMNSYRFSDVIFVKIRLIFVLYNADTEIERVNSMTIRKMANEELSQCVDVIRKSYETEAVAFGITLPAARRLYYA